MARFKSVVSSLDQVPEEHREHYTKVEDPKSPAHGKFVFTLDVVDGFSVRNIDNLQAALNAERGKAEEAEKKLKLFGDLDPGKARDALTRVEEMKNWTPEDKVKAQIQREVGEAKSKLEADLKAARDTNEKLEGRFRRMLITTEGTAAIAKLKGNVDLLMPLVERSARIKFEGEKPVVFFEGENGQPILSKKAGTTDPMGAEEFVEGLRERFAQAFEGHGGSGTGSEGAKGKGGPRQPWEITKTEAGDFAKYEIASKAATAAGRSMPVIVEG